MNIAHSYFKCRAEIFTELLVFIMQNVCGTQTPGAAAQCLQVSGFSAAGSSSSRVDVSASLREWRGSEQLMGCSGSWQWELWRGGGWTPQGHCLESCVWVWVPVLQFRVHRAGGTESPFIVP